MASSLWMFLFRDIEVWLRDGELVLPFNISKNGYADRVKQIKRTIEQ
jgi:hypothetical protein